MSALVSVGQGEWRGIHALSGGWKNKGEAAGGSDRSATNCLWRLIACVVSTIRREGEGTEGVDERGGKVERWRGRWGWGVQGRE